MIKHHLISAFIIATLALAGCASSPKTLVNYYPPATMVEVKIIQTAGCQVKTKDNKIEYIPKVVTKVEANSKYVRGSGDPETLDLSIFDGPFTTSSVEMKLSKEGLFKGLVTEQTGVGSEILEGAFELGARSFAGNDTKRGCEFINALKDKQFQLTRTLVMKLDGALPPAPVTIEQDSLSKLDWTNLEPIFGKAKITFPGKSRVIKPITKVEGYKGKSLKLFAPTELSMTITNSRQTYKDAKYKYTILLHKSGDFYYVPVPRPPVFGANNFTLDVTESGLLTGISHKKTNGAAGALGSLNRFVDLIDGQTRQEKLDALKIENDILAQQARQIKCLSDPDECK